MWQQKAGGGGGRITPRPSGAVSFINTCQTFKTVQIALILCSVGKAYSSGQAEGAWDDRSGRCVTAVVMRRRFGRMPEWSRSVPELSNPDHWTGQSECHSEAGLRLRYQPIV